jgi:hypothetical protein
MLELLRVEQYKVGDDRWLWHADAQLGGDIHCAIGADKYEALWNLAKYLTEVEEG